jgi:predicted MFS family arabinose efflux permease
MVAAVPVRPAPPLRFAIAGMIAMAVAMGIGRFVYTLILPGMMEGLGLSAADAGLIASANYLGYLVGALLAAGGWASGRERALMLAGLAGTALLALSMGLTESLALFLVIRFLAGVASAFVMVFLASIVFSHLAAAGRSDLQSVYFAGVGVGIALSSALMLFLIAAWPDWRAGWHLSAALSAAGFIAVALLIDRGPLANGAAGREPGLPKSAALVKVILAYGLFGLGYIVTATFLVAIVREGEGGPSFEAIVWLGTGLAAVTSVFLWNRVAVRTGLAVAYLLACFVEAAGVTASVTASGYAGPLVAGVLLGGTFVAITALGLQLGRRLAPLAPRRTFALMTASFGLGQIIGPLLAGYAASVTGSFFLPSLGAAAALLASGLIALSARAATAEASPKSP